MDCCDPNDSLADIKNCLIDITRITSKPVRVNLESELEMSIIQYLHVGKLNYVICIQEVQKKYFSKVNGFADQMFHGKLSGVDLAGAMTQGVESILVRKEGNCIK